VAGSAALLLRSAAGSSRLSALPAFRHGRVGAGVGFNYGTSVVARWADRFSRPGWAGQQVAFIATKAGDERFILENGFIPPGVMAPLLPGWGRTHRAWALAYDRLAMTVNTIGSPSTGRVDARGRGGR
jgi:hypothetical protein